MKTSIRLSVKVFLGLFMAYGLMFLPLSSKAQQFFSYTQYMNNLVPVNQASSLLDENGSVSTIYRKQWAGIEGAPTTFLFTSAVPLPNIGAATGLTIMDDKFAVEHQTEVNAYFAKSIQLAPGNFLAVSLDAGIRKYMADYSSLDPSDPSFSSDYRETRANIGFGVMYYTNQYYLGVSVPEINLRSLGNGSVENNSYFRNHYYFSGAYLFGNDDDDFRLKPAFLYTYTQGVTSVADISGTLYIKSLLGVGFNYRTNKEAAAIMTVNVNTFSFGYSYQFGTASNTISGVSFATHEITLTYHFGEHLDHIKLL